MMLWMSFPSVYPQSGICICGLWVRLARVTHLTKGYVRFTVGERMRGKMITQIFKVKVWKVANNLEVQTSSPPSCCLKAVEKMTSIVFPPGLHWWQPRYGGVPGGQWSRCRPRRQRGMDTSPCHRLLWIPFYSQVPARPRQQRGRGEQWRGAGDWHFWERRDGGAAAEGDRCAEGELRRGAEQGGAVHAGRREGLEELWKAWGPTAPQNGGNSIARSSSKRVSCSIALN